MSRGLQYNK